MLSKSQVISLNLKESQAPPATLTFFDWVTKRQIHELEQNYVVRKLMFKTIWDLEHGQYREVSENELFSLVSQMRIERLNLSKNKKPNIIREVKQVSFPLLTKLLLNDNFITSLEFLDHLSCPNLQALALMNNKISHIRSFKKAKFPNLNYIGLEKNFIQNFSSMTLMLSDNFTQLLIQIDTNDKVMGHDITWVSKIKSQQLREIKCLGKNRINMDKTKKMLTKKFQELEFQDKFKVETN